MRSVIVLCLLAALCSVNGAPTSEDLEALKVKVRNTKWSVDSVIRQLQRLRKETGEDTVVKVTRKWWEQMDNHREYTDMLVTALDSEVTAAKKAGKNVDNCYNTAIDGIKKNNEVADKSGKDCKDTAEKSITSNLGFLDNLITTGNALTTELDGIFVNCYDEEARMQFCIVSELGKIEGKVETLKTDATTAEATTMPISNNVVLQASSCIRNAYGSIYAKNTAIMLAANECMKNAGSGGSGGDGGSGGSGGSGYDGGSDGSA